MSERAIIQSGFSGGGRLECDGKDHFVIREEHESLNVARETHVGPCLTPEGCQRTAERLKKEQPEQKAS